MKVHVYLAAAAACLGASAPAVAHATLETTRAVIGQPYKAIIRIAHGCAGEATRSVRVNLPPELINAKPMPKPGWSVSAGLAPGARHEINWTGGLLEDGHYDEFVVMASVAATAVPQYVHLPVIQECANGAERWIDTPDAANPARRLKAPAPRLELVAGEAAPSPAATQAGDLKLEAAWTRATPKGAQVGGGYLRITNTGKTSDRLIGGSFPLAARVEVHEMATEGGMMKMRRLAAGLEIKPGETVELKPGGYHLMFLQLKEAIAAGKPVRGTLVFEKAGSVDVEYGVAPIGAREMPAAGQGGHGHH